MKFTVFVHVIISNAGFCKNQNIEGTLAKHINSTFVSSLALAT